MSRFASFLALLLLALPLTPHALGQQAVCEGGHAVVGGTQYDCNAVNLLSHVTLGQMSASAGNDIWGWTDPETGKEYALMGVNNGTAFVDVTDPANPVYLGKLPTHTDNSTWRDIKVYADHAFVVSEAWSHGMQVFDLTELRDVESPPVTFSETAHYDGFGSAHNLAINEATGFAYGVGSWECAGGLHMVNIQDPLNPTFAGCFAEDGYTHDVQCVVYHGPDADYTGQEICFASNEDTVTIVDVTDKANPVELSQAIYPNTAYTHQGWLTEDHRTFIANDEIDEGTYDFNTRTLIFDVSDLDSPEHIDEFYHPVAATDHNSYIKGRYAFQSNYKSGLRIVDLQSSGTVGGGLSLEEVAFFDTYTQSNSSGYEGTWSNYPFFESGIVVVSDINSGLFVLDPQLGTPPVATEDAAPGTFAVSEAYPNPTSGRTQIDLTIGDAQHVEVVVYDVLGRHVADLFHGQLGAGEARTFSFDGSALPAGLYFIRATGEDFAETRQVSLTR